MRDGDVFTFEDFKRERRAGVETLASRAVKLAYSFGLESHEIYLKVRKVRRASWGIAVGVYRRDNAQRIGEVS